MVRQLTMDAPATPEQHRAWPRLTADQRKAINEVWDEMVNPALGEVNVMRREVTEARMEAQDARYARKQAEDAYARLLWATRADA